MAADPEADLPPPELADATLDCWPSLGFARQRDRTRPAEYGEAYWAKYAERDRLPIARALLEARREMVGRHMVRGYACDVGIGAGAFMRGSGLCLCGYDINPVAERWLRDRGLWLDPYDEWPRWLTALTMWDVIEHLPEPARLLSRVPTGGWVFASLPIAESVEPAWLAGWKHYRPDEHYRYWTRLGFLAWMESHGFRLAEANAEETRAGRQDIESFAFTKQ